MVIDRPYILVFGSEILVFRQQACIDLDSRQCIFHGAPQ